MNDNLSMDHASATHFICVLSEDLQRWERSVLSNSGAHSAEYQAQLESLLASLVGAPNGPDDDAFLRELCQRLSAHEESLQALCGSNEYGDHVAQVRSILHSLSEREGAQHALRFAEMEEELLQELLN